MCFLTTHKTSPLSFIQSIPCRPNLRDSSDQSTPWPQGKYAEKSRLHPDLCFNPQLAQEAWEILNWIRWDRANYSQGQPLISDPGGAVPHPTLMNPGRRCLFLWWTVGRGAGLGPELLSYLRWPHTAVGVQL